VVLFVLSGAAVFFIYIARRAAAYERGELASGATAARTAGITP
jgi:hypothetical protein